MSKEHIKHRRGHVRRGYLSFSALRVARFSDSGTAIDFAIPCGGTVSPSLTVVSVVKLKYTSSVADFSGRLHGVPKRTRRIQLAKKHFRIYECRSVHFAEEIHLSE